MIRSNDEYLKPVLQDDPIIYAFDDMHECAEDGQERVECETDLSWKEKYKSLLGTFEAYKSSVSAKFCTTLNLNEKDLNQKVDFHEAEQDPYFRSYAYTDIHEDMLKDRVRTDSYRDFFYLNKHLFHGKVGVWVEFLVYYMV